MSIPKFCVWYKLADERYNVYYLLEDKLEVVDKLSNIKINQFEFKLKHIKPSEVLLKEYAEKIIVWRNEILNCKSLKVPFDYFDNYLLNSDGTPFYRTHANNICTFIKRFIKKDYLKYDKITIWEEEIFLKCHRGGLTYCKPGVYDCYGYDMKFFYPSIMASKDYMIPTKQGKLTKITAIPEKFEYGIYNVGIKSENSDFNKIFAKSKDKYYTHYSLNFALEYIKKYKTKDIELVLLSGEALVYDSECLVSGFSVFNCWYNRMLELKQQFPKNPLVKNLGSTSWGELQDSNVIIRSEKEIIEQKLSIGFGYDKEYHIKKITIKDEGDIYKLVPTSNIYKYNFRFKAFITDYARIKIAKVALLDINNVIRIQTDGIVYDKPLDRKIQNFVLEEDKTGTFEWFNVNSWEKINH